MSPSIRTFPAKYLFLALAFLGCSAALQGASGELDLSFDPVAEEMPVNLPRVAINGEEVYVFGQTTIRRLLPNGRRDPEWKLAAPVASTQFVTGFGALPAGGWYVGGFSGGYLEGPDHHYVTIPWTGIEEAFPQGNGGLVVPDVRGPYRFTAAGLVDSTYKARAELPNLLRASAMDSRDRLIVGGHFKRAGVREQFVLARLLPDGTREPGWNPDSQLNLTLEGGYPTVTVVAIGPEDSVLVELRLRETAPLGEPTHEWIWINAEGEVTVRSFAAGSIGGFVRPAIQPDGKVIVSELQKWDGTTITGGVRLERDGSLDPTWNLNLDTPWLSSLVLDRSGRLLISGPFSRVNGVSRPGLARVFVYDPPTAPPEADIVTAQPRVTTNETLWLSARVGGYPPPTLQWFRNGEAIAGATNRGLEVVIQDANAAGAFHLVASSETGVKQLNFPTVAVTERSPAPGQTAVLFGIDPTWGTVHQMIVQPDGKILLGFGQYGFDLSYEGRVRLARLTPEGALDPTFGKEGIVKGNGRLESMRLLPDGGILVAGLMSNLGDRSVSGVAELDANGNVKPLSFPVLNNHHATTALKLRDGRYVVAGSFTNIGGMNAFRLARLTVDLQPDAGFKPHLEFWQMVSDLAEDAQGRLLIAGGGLEFEAEQGPLGEVALVGVQRLLDNGAADPAFTVSPERATTLFVEPGGTILAGMPARRLNDRGEVVTKFAGQLTPVPQWQWPPGSRYTDHRMVRSQEGGVLFDAYSPSAATTTLNRWEYFGARNYDFPPQLPQKPARIDSAALMPDGSILLAVLRNINVTNLVDNQLIRVLPDFDLRFTQTQKTDAGIKASILTQPGFHYTVRQRPNLSGPAGTVVAELEGDGYRQDVVIPDSSVTGFLEYIRD